MPKLSEYVMKPCVKVFSATRHADRNSMGEQITKWLNQDPLKHVDDVVVRQSSDAEFHCVTIIYFYSVKKEL